MAARALVIISENKFLCGVDFLDGCSTNSYYLIKTCFLLKKIGIKNKGDFLLQQRLAE